MGGKAKSRQRNTGKLQVVGIMAPAVCVHHHHHHRHHHHHSEFQTYNIVGAGFYCTEGAFGYF
jgi:hypothetical protein